MKVLLFLGLCVAFTLGARKRYDGWQIWELTPATQLQVDALKILRLDNDIVFEGEPYYPGNNVNIIFPPEKLAGVMNHVTSANVPYVVKNINFQNHLDDLFAKIDARRSAARSQNRMDYGIYNTYDDIMSEMENMTARCQSPIVCATQVIGQSHEGRDIKMLTVSNGTSGRGIYVMDSLIHAREWLAGATVMNIMNRMTTEYGSNSQVAGLLDKYDFYFIPVMNPDGYVWSHTTERLWRKSRAPNAGSAACEGVDLNRNYDWQWGGDGTSGDECSEVFRGYAAGSEIETQVIQNYAATIASRVQSWCTIHTSAQMWIHPWGHTDIGGCVIADDDADMDRVAAAAANAMEAVYGAVWRRGNSCIVIYPTTGTTGDYLKGVHNIKYAFTPELGGGGFEAPVEEISLSFPEFWDGVVAQISEIEAIEGVKK